jgi:hypothetical protein
MARRDACERVTPESAASVGWPTSCGHLSDGERVASFCRARTRSGDP